MDEKELILTYIKQTGIDPSQDLPDEISLQEMAKLLKERIHQDSVRLKFIEMGGEKGYLNEDDFKNATQKIMFRNLSSGDRMMFKEFKSIIATPCYNKIP
jgi:hypothetical protein